MVDSNHRTPKITDIQSIAFNHSATYPNLMPFGRVIGATQENRTPNLPITSRVLYRIELEWHLSCLGSLGCPKPFSSAEASSREPRQERALVHFRIGIVAPPPGKVKKHRSAARSAVASVHDAADRGSRRPAIHCTENA